MRLIKIQHLKNLLFIFILIAVCSNLLAQESRRPIQFSGMIIEGDSLNPIPFSTILIRNKPGRGTISDFYGFFSFVAQENDTIVFSCVGYKQATFIIPDTLSEQRYSVIQALLADTINLPEATVYSWPTREQFRDAFLNMKFHDDDYERAMRSLNKEKMILAFNNIPMDASMNAKFVMNQYQTKLYQTGQVPTISLTNPIAWAQFIQAWRAGMFRKK